MMKKGLLMLCMVLTTCCVMAQTHSLGLQVGFGSPTYRLNTPTEMGNSRTKLQALPLYGTKIGLVYDMTLVKGFGFSMGLNYNFAMQQEGWKDYNYTSTGEPTKYALYEYQTKYQFHQGEVFVDWQYKFEIAKQTYIILYTGPTIQCMFSFKAKDFYRIKLGDTGIVSPVESYEASLDDRIQRLNITWGLGAGFQYKRYFLRGGYDFGLINPYSKQSFSDYGYRDDDRLTRGRLDQWQVRIGMYLWQSNED